MSKILLLDIETRPASAYVWGLFDVNISLDQLIDSGGVLCFGAKWLGSPDLIFHSDWDDGHEEMIKKAWELIDEADAVVTYNGDSFDLPKLRGEFLVNKLPPPAPTTSIDVYKSVKKLGLLSKKLAFVGPFLKVGAKVKNAGWPLWLGVLAGNELRQKQMKRYCLQDVKLLEKVYVRVKPFIHNHPHMGTTGSNACGACGSEKLHSRGVRRTKAFRIQRLQCQNCGSWQDGKRMKV